MNRHDLLDQVFDAVERDDLEFVERWFERNAHPDIEFTSAMTSGVEGRVYRGKRGLVDWANDVSEAVDITYGEREYRDVGDNVVVVLVRPSLEGRGSGVRIELEVGFAIEFEGQIARKGASYASHDKTLSVASKLAAASQANAPKIDLVRAGQIALERGDRDAFSDVVDRLMHPDGEWEPLLTAVEGGPYRGPKGVLEWFDDFIGTMEVRYEAPEFVAIGDNVVLTLGAMRLRGRGSDIEVTRDVGTVYEFEGERVRRGRVYESRDEAIAAAEAVAGDEPTEAEPVR